MESSCNLESPSDTCYSMVMAHSGLRGHRKKSLAQAERGRTPSNRLKEGLIILSAAQDLFTCGLRSRGFTRPEIEALWRAGGPTRGR